MLNTLGRQLLAGVSLIFLLALAGVGWIYLANARVYLQEQLESHAQDTSTSLGLSLGTVLARGDPALAETVINAVFDRGYYERIVFVSVSGETLVRKELSPAESGVPAWFVALLPLRAPTAESLVSAGWRQIGRVKVTSHPRFAYRQLWQTGIETAGWLAAIYALALLAMRAFLGGILRPLEQIGRAAIAIGERDFAKVSFAPRSRELRRVVAAINSLSEKVRAALEAEARRADRLQREVFVDPLTGLWNRPGFTQQFDTRVRDERDVFSGLVALLEFDDFARFNRENGYARGDELLKRIAAAIEATAPGPGPGTWADIGPLGRSDLRHRPGECRT